MSKTFKRSIQLSKVVERDLAVLLKQQFDDCRLAVIQRVVLSDDLAHANIHINCLNIEMHCHNVADIVTLLNQQKKYLRHCLAKQANMRRTPNLHFFEDKNITRARFLDDLITGSNTPDTHTVHTPPQD
jgi:ribosome-binding factor A